MDASLLRVGKPVGEIVRDPGVQAADSGGGAAAHGREGPSGGRAYEGRPCRPVPVRQDGSAMAIGLDAAFACDVESDD
jgi:hypothetical protein